MFRIDMKKDINQLKELIVSVLSDKAVAYRREFAYFGGVKVAVFLSQLFYWIDKGNLPGWIYKTADEFEAETGLTRREQATARGLLKSKGIIDEKLAGNPARLHYRINIDTLLDALSGLDLPKTQNKIYPNVQTSFTQNAKQDLTKSQNKIAPKRKTLYTENTTENTTESTTENGLAPAPITNDRKWLIDLFDKTYTHLNQDRLIWANGKSPSKQMGAINKILSNAESTAKNLNRGTREYLETKLRIYYQLCLEGNEFWQEQAFTPHGFYTHWEKIIPTAIKKRPRAKQKTQREIDADNFKRKMGWIK